MCVLEYTISINTHVWGIQILKEKDENTQIKTFQLRGKQASSLFRRCTVGG